MTVKHTVAVRVKNGLLKLKYVYIAKECRHKDAIYKRGATDLAIKWLRNLVSETCP